MTTPAPKHDEAFKREAVRLLEESGKSVSELSRELDITEKMLYRWKQKYGTPPSQKTTMPTNEEELRKELKALRRENERLRLEHEILKKALSIFSR